MNVTLFTSNQPRHVALVERLMAVAESLSVVLEADVGFDRETGDDPLGRYFRRVQNAEESLFGGHRFLSGDVRQLAIAYGEASRLEPSALGDALNADVILVFGASFIRGALAEALVERRAVNIHMGISPFYRGTATNFWALYDGLPDYVGATIHLLGRGLDSGPMLLHAFPPAEPTDPFLLGMQAVDAAFEAVVERLRSDRLLGLEPAEQDRRKERRYARAADFTAEVAAEYMTRLPSPDDVGDALRARDESLFLRPYVQGRRANP